MKDELLKSVIDGGIVENEKLNLRSDNVTNCEQPISVVKEFDNIIKCKKKRMVNLAYKQGLLFQKFKELGRFKKILKDIGISKSTIYF